MILQVIIWLALAVCGAVTIGVLLAALVWVVLNYGLAFLGAAVFIVGIKLIDKL